MTDRMLAVLLAASILAFVSPADAQPAPKIPRLGFLSSRSPDVEKSRLAGFQQGLRELGYSPGQNILVEYRYAGGKFDRLPDLAAELVRLGVDVLVTTGAPASHAAKDATRTIPIVMTNAADPVGTGLVASLARPGGNVTGLSDFNEGVITKRLELLKDLVPSASRVAVLVNPANPTNPPQLKHIQATAPALGVTLLALELRGPDDLDRAFGAMRRERAEALMVLGDPMFDSYQRRITELAVKNRLPAIHVTRAYVDAGALMAYGANFADLYRRSATYVDKILKGAKPADLPVEQPTTFELAINLKTAKALGLTIPPAVLARADHVVQ